MLNKCCLDYLSHSNGLGNKLKPAQMIWNPTISTNLERFFKNIVQSSMAAQ